MGVISSFQRQQAAYGGLTDFISSSPRGRLFLYGNMSFFPSPIVLVLCDAISHCWNSLPRQREMEMANFACNRGKWKPGLSSVMTGRGKDVLALAGILQAGVAEEEDVYRSLAGCVTYDAGCDNIVITAVKISQLTLWCLVVQDDIIWLNLEGCTQVWLNEVCWRAVLIVQRIFAQVYSTERSQRWYGMQGKTVLPTSRWQVLINCSMASLSLRWRIFGKTPALHALPTSAVVDSVCLFVLYFSTVPL